MRVLAPVLALSLGGCVTSEKIHFAASGPSQQSIVRDGQAALVSRQKNSIVLVKPASRQIAPNGRPVLIVAITNLSQHPIDFRVSQVEAAQVVGGQTSPMTVVTYEELVQEEKTRQVAASIVVGLAAAANTYSASRAGYGSYTTHSGRTGTFYSPTAAAIAQGNAAVQNDAMIANTIERGQMNMATLEKVVIKDNTLMPGEWYGGQLHLSPPTSPPTGGAKTYSIALLVGPDRHVIDISQSAQKQ